MHDDEEKKALMPKLQFPEFRRQKGWNDWQFDELYDFKPTNTFSRDSSTTKSEW